MEDNQITLACRILVERGWIPLRKMSFLLGHKHPTGIYQRQKGPHAIPTIKVDGTYRVYFDDAIHALENPLRTAQQEDTQPILSIIRRLKKEQDKLNQEDDQDE